MRESNEAKFALSKEGPSIRQIKSLEERLETIVFRQSNNKIAETLDIVKIFDHTMILKPMKR